MTRAIDWVGAVLDDWGHLDYPNIGFCQDNVIVSWTRAVPRPLAGQHQGARLLVAPISWFYEDEPAYQDPAKSPQLLVGAADTQIPATWIENRFLVNLNDVARALGREAGHVAIAGNRIDATRVKAARGGAPIAVLAGG